ncbi:hypothetical protein ABEB36_002592 [Hypothenemus hampei]|uniref:MADF domain-containing protein n=1 Tax=Hypothenemus hampei TaxID=57062 RepID=A0ABD1F6A1_HYPHA
MTDIRHMNRKFLVEFMMMYKSLPCLWDISSVEYTDRKKKKKAYQHLLNKYKEYDPNGNLQNVKNKIDSFRSTFRRELKKVNDSKKLAGPDGIYRPHLWYFDLLLFLTGQTKSKLETDNVDAVHISTEEIDIKSEIEEIQTPIRRFSMPETSFDQSTDNSICTNFCSMSKSVKKKANAENMLHTVQERADRPDKIEDEFNVSGKNIANKLRNLPPDVAIVTEKLLMDVLFEAHLGNITQHSRISINNMKIVQG